VLITVTILMILALAAIPSFDSFMKESKAVEIINGLTKAVYLTRTTALKEEIHVTLCKSSDGAECSGNWEDGYIIFKDINRNATVDAGEEIIKHQSKLPQGTTLTWNSGQTYLRMTPYGYTDSTLGNFKYCPPQNDPQYGKGFTVNRPGRVKMFKDTDSNGIVEKSGTDITCP